MEKKEAGSGRRDFLKLAGVSAPAAVAAAAVGSAPAEASEEFAGEGMRKTEHVKKYLETARF